MDSMRSLNTSLPRTGSPKKSRKQPPPDKIIQAFKAAALSVTNLYKEAAADQAAAHEAGYQEALEDLLAHLDKEGLGLVDTEGKKIRQWINSRYQGSTNPPNASDSEEELEEEKRARSSSPVIERKQADEEALDEAQEASLPRQESAPPTLHVVETPSQPALATIPTNADFSFRSSHPYPTSNDTDMDTMESVTLPANAAQAMPSMRVEVLPRGHRSSPRNNNRNGRNGSTTSSQSSGIGTKRRLDLDGVWDMNSLNINRKRRR